MNLKNLSRQIAFFGEQGQAILNQMNIVLVGAGGVGSHVAQQLAFLNVCSITIIDDDILDDTNFNRLIGVTSNDVAGIPKVEIIYRHLKSINPDIEIRCIPEKLNTANSFDAVKSANFVFSCVDNDGARLVINDLCLAYEIPFIDAASDILEENAEYGGRICCVIDSTRCLYCLGEIDGEEAKKYLAHPDERKDVEKIYGVDKMQLNGGGPSVVTINGIVASMAVTEFMLYVTEIRPPSIAAFYRGSMGTMTKTSAHDSTECYYCQSVRGLRDKAEVEADYLSNH